ncbi:MAG: methyltransferase domain-containing protein [Planctomycetota bacterium]
MGQGARERPRPYDATWLDGVPEAVWESSAAVGNPFEIAPIENGQTVVDLGCGAGADACVAALLVGEQGRVIGVDLVHGMVAKARANVARMGLSNAEIREADMAKLPLPDGCADVVISNGAINLSPRKPCVLAEAYRILKPGVRMLVADMVRKDVPQTGTAESSESWADCVAGTVASECFLEMLAQAGFAQVRLLRTTPYQTAESTIGALFYAQKPPDGIEACAH